MPYLTKYGNFVPSIKELQALITTLSTQLMNQIVEYKVFALLFLFTTTLLSAQPLAKKNPLSDFGCTLHSEKTNQSLIDFNSAIGIDADAINKPQAIKSAPNTHPIISLAKQYLGRPYRSGGKGPKGFDCSGFTSYIYKQFGIELPPSSHEQAAKAIDKIAKQEANVGDLAFFGYKTPKGKVIINHAAIIISGSNQPVKIIHAANHKGICITDVDKSRYWKQTFLFAGRLKQKLIAQSKIAALLLSDWQDGAPVI